MTRIAPNPPELTALGANLERMGRDERGRIEEGAPRDKFAIGANWSFANWGVNGNATRYGDVVNRHATNPAQDQTFSSKWTVDLSANYRPNQNWTVTVGADNVLDEYPEESIFANSTFGLFPYSLYSPFGFNGRYLYGRIAYKW